MLPIELLIENFYCHGLSKIDFTAFDSAVIVGKINGNDKYSNGAGKSTIFSAIKYVLYNEVETSSLEKIIKHGKDFCRVSYTFKSSFDEQTYKIVRFRSRKTSAEVRLFKINGENWDDLTQRTSTETEKEILKILKINWKTFSNSILFAQGDISGIAGMTPRERKTALKEALQLGIYSKYESIVKKKKDEFTKEMEKNQVIISTIGDPEKDLLQLNSQTSSLLSAKESAESSVAKHEEDLLLVQENLSKAKREFDDLQSKTDISNKETYELEMACKSIRIETERLEKRILELENQEKNNISYGKKLFIELKELKSIKSRPSEEIAKNLFTVREKLIECQSDYKTLSFRLKNLRIPFCEETVCKHCRQKIDPASREECEKAINLEIIEVENSISKIINLVEKLPIEEKKLIEEQISNNKREMLFQKITSELEETKKKIVSDSALLQEFRTMKEVKYQEAEAKAETWKNIINNQGEENRAKERAKISSTRIHLTIKQNNIIADKLVAQNNVSTLSSQYAVLLHKIETRKIDSKKIEEIRSILSNLEYQIVLHQKVLQAFGPSGIPTLITHTVLDDYQIESNLILDRLRPGLRLQFMVEKKKDEEVTGDTLEVSYFLNNTELEFPQLSGAQKLLVSLALRLGLVAVIRKRLGIDLKMILIDEVDQSLDEAALETFEDAIKDLQQEYKILVITHNPAVKTKFGHAIVIEQDNDLNSTATLVEGGVG